MTPDLRANPFYLDEEQINAWTLEQSKKLWGELNHREY